MSMRAATQQDFPTVSMPASRGVLPFNITASSDFYRRLMRGKVPQEMEDRWFVYADGDWVFIHRAWTGFCTFQLRFEPGPGGHDVAEAWVNLDPAQNRLTEADEPAELANQAARLRRLLDWDLLHLGP